MRSVEKKVEKNKKDAIWCYLSLLSGTLIAFSPAPSNATLKSLAEMHV